MQYCSLSARYIAWRNGHVVGNCVTPGIYDVTSSGGVSIELLILLTIVIS